MGTWNAEQTEGVGLETFAIVCRILDTSLLRFHLSPRMLERDRCMSDSAITSTSYDVTEKTQLSSRWNAWRSIKLADFQPQCNEAVRYIHSMSVVHGYLGNHNF